MINFFKRAFGRKSRERSALLQRRVDKKRGNTKASELSNYEQRHAELMRGRG